MQNTVEIDQAALEREASSIPLGDPPPAEPGAPGADGAQPGAADAGAGEPTAERIAELAAGVEPFVHGLVDVLHANLAPNWRIAPEKQTALAKSGALALALWFPHELPPKYLALMAVAGCAWSIAQDNRNPQTGAYQPRYAPQTSSNAGNAAAAS